MALERSRAAARAAAALASPGASRALDRIAPPECSNANRGGAGAHRAEPTRSDHTPECPDRKPRRWFHGGGLPWPALHSGSEPEPSPAKNKPNRTRRKPNRSAIGRYARNLCFWPISRADIAKLVMQEPRCCSHLRLSLILPLVACGPMFPRPSLPLTEQGRGYVSRWFSRVIRAEYGALRSVLTASASPRRPPMRRRDCGTPKPAGRSASCCEAFTTVHS